jgi:hypothetical protein
MTEDSKSIIVTLNWEATCEWFARALAEHAFDRSTTGPVVSFIEQHGHQRVRRQDNRHEGVTASQRITGTTGTGVLRGNLEQNAGVAQLAERQPSKLHVASSNLVSRSTIP